MSFLNLTYLQFVLLTALFSALAAYLYLRKPPAPQLVIPSLVLWQKILKKRLLLLPQRRLTLSLMLQLCILVLLALGVAEPRWTFSELQGLSSPKDVVAILDLSLSMQAADANGRSRIDEAKSQVERIGNSLDPADSLTLVTMGINPQVVFGWDFETDEGASELSKISALDSTADVRAALDFVVELLRDDGLSESKEVVLLTDGFFTPEEVQFLSELPNRLTTEGIVFRMLDLSIEVATRRNNVAMTAFAARRYLGIPHLSQALVEVRNLGQVPQDLTLLIRDAERVLVTVPLRLGERETYREVFENLEMSTAGARLTASFDLDDAIQKDNHAFAYVPALRDLKAVVTRRQVDHPNYLSEALSLHSEVRFVEPGQDAFVVDSADPVGLLVFENVSVEEADLSGSHDYWLVNPQGPAFLDSDPFAPRRPYHWNGQHPATKDVDIKNLSIPTARNVKILPGDAVLLGSAARPLIVARETGFQRLIIVGFDLAGSNLPQQLGFPRLVSNILDWTRGTPDTEWASYRSGQVLIPLPQNPNSLRPHLILQHEDGSQIESGVQSGFLSFPAPRSGFYQLVSKDPARGVAANLIAVNAGDETEGDLIGSPRIDNWQILRADLALLPQISTFWVLFLVAAGLLILTEWFLYNRGITD